jgi:hypothetical protein
LSTHSGLPVLQICAPPHIPFLISDGIEIDKHLPPSRRKIVGVYGFALLLAPALFYFHVIVIFDVIGEIPHYKAWLLENLGPKHTGKPLLLSCFLALMSAHVIDAAAWGLFFAGHRCYPVLPRVFTSALHRSQRWATATFC